MSDSMGFCIEVERKLEGCLVVKLDVDAAPGGDTVDAEANTAVSGLLEVVLDATISVVPVDFAGPEMAC